MLIEIFYNSILAALVLSLVAIGFNLIFNATKVFHLAHGAIYVYAVFGLYYFNALLIQCLSPVLAAIISILLSLILIVGIILLIEFLVYRPLYHKGTNPTISLISSLGIYILAVNILTFFYGNESVSINNNFNIIFSGQWFIITESEFVQFLICGLTLIGVFFFSKSKYYVHIRAIGDNYAVSAKFGINIQKTRLIALIAGSLLVGIAGMVKGYDIAIDPHSGMTITLAAAVAVIIGGEGSLKGTFLACLVIALIDNFSVLLFSSQWKDTITYILLILILLFYKKGLISINQRIEAQ
jgi:branched-chain amino acid transport system permease protein